MAFDNIFVLGLLTLACGVPSLAGAYAERRRPSKAFLIFLIGGAMVYYANAMNPDTYSLSTMDDVILAVIGRLLNQ